MKIIFTWKNYLFIYAALLLILNLLLINLPLTNVFGYEFAAINAIAISFLSGIYIISSFKKGTENSSLKIITLFKNLSVLLLIPFIVSIINSIISGFCSFTDGLLFYLVVTGPSVVIGGALGMIAFGVVSRFGIIIYILLFISVFLISLFEIYFNPQVYLYNPIFGFFPGTIYDEGLSVDFRLFFYRLLNTIYFFGIILLMYNAIKAGKKKLIIWRRVFLSFIIVVCFYFFISPAWGFSTTFSKLKNELNVRIETEHFVTYADSEMDENTLKFIALNQEYFYEKLSIFLDEGFETKINSFIFNSSQQKKELFGSGNADVAKPWQKSVYVSEESWEQSLEHEIAHCFAGRFGWGIFEVASGFNPALIEGIAEACDGFYDEIDIHFLASIAHNNNYKIEISELFLHFSFFGNVSGLSYIYSGSFIKYLIENFGVDKVKRYYRTNDFEKSFGKSINDIEKEYSEFLNSFAAAVWKDRAVYYFGRKALIQKVCPRYISDRLKVAWELFNQKEYISSKNKFEEILEKSVNYSAIVGVSLIHEKIDSIDTAVEFLEDNIEKFNSTSYEFNLKFRIAELMVKSGKLNEAKQIYESLVVSKPTVRLELLARMRLTLLKESKISKYVLGSEFDKYYLLKQLNSDQYEYSAIPIMINLSESLDENYDLFIANFKNNIDVTDVYSSYAALKLSQYMLINFDYLNSIKMAGLSLRYKNDSSLYELKRENFNKVEWFRKNAENILSGIKISKNSIL
jgi:hypothetical protein